MLMRTLTLIGLSMSLGALGCGSDAASDVACVDGKAGLYPCSNIDLAAFVPTSELDGSFDSTSSIWGWTHEASGREFALVGLSTGTAFVEVTNPQKPVLRARLSAGDLWIFSDSAWRELEVMDDHAYIVSEATGHALVIADLLPLLDVKDGEVLDALPFIRYTGGPATPPV
jgi:choice-of-anchor B domain-containing protein